MSGTYEFDPNKQADCDRAEDYLADALDGVLSPADQAWFDAHTAGCAPCSDRLAQAQRGAAWLELLKTPRPEPSAMLYDRILAATEGGMRVAEPQPAPAVAPARAAVLPFRTPAPHWVGSRGLYLQPRLAMTAAMAFFSIALTLSLTGVRLDQVRWADLNPAQLSPAHLERSVFEAKAQALRSYDGLRVVHVLESRVDDLKEASGLNENSREPHGNRERHEPAAEPPAERPTEPAERMPKPAGKKRDGGISQAAPTGNQVAPTGNEQQPQRTAVVPPDLAAAMERKAHA